MNLIDVFVDVVSPTLLTLLNFFDLELIKYNVSHIWHQTGNIVHFVLKEVTVLRCYHYSDRFIMVLMTVQQLFLLIAVKKQVCNTTSFPGLIFITKHRNFTNLVNEISLKYSGHNAIIN